MKKRTSDTRVMLGAVGIAGGVLLAGAVVASAMLRTTFEPASARAAEASENGSAPAEGVAAATSSTAAAKPDATRPQPATLTSGPAQLSNQVLVLAAARAPFDPERQAPAGRYLFPEERIVPAPPPEPEPPPTPPFRVVGAVAGIAGAGPGRPGGIAVVQPEGQQPKILKVGDEFMGYRISSVEADVVVASSRGWDVSIPVEGLTPTRMAAGGNTRNAQQARNQANQANQLAGDFQKVLDQLRQRYEAVAGQVNGNVQVDGQTGNGQFRFQMQNGTAIITGPNGQRQEIQIPAGGQGQPDVVEKIIVAPGNRVVRPGGGQ